MKKLKIAIVYDRVNTFGGAEQVLLALHQAFPDAPLYTSVFDPKKTTWVGDWEVHTSFLQHIPFARNHHEWFGWLMPLAFETLDLSPFDTVISVTSEAAKGILTKPEQLHICYCLTPTRYLWSHTSEYGAGSFGWLKRLFFTPLREWDFIAGQRPDKIIAISEHVARRVEKYYRRKVDGVIYPPVSSKQQVVSSKERTYFLVVSRLVPYKKIDVAIRACMRAQKKLVIVGTGSDEMRLRDLARGNPLVTLVGFVSDTELAQYYQHAIALICPQEEDFGIVSLEAQAQGTPVISQKKSGMVETIVADETGFVYTDDLDWALQQAEQKQWNREKIKKNVQRFQETIFLEQWRKEVYG